METRTELVMLRVNPTERRLLEAAAATNAVALATWTRQAAVESALKLLRTSTTRRPQPASR